MQRNLGLNSLRQILHLEFLFLDLILQFHQTIQHVLRARRAAWNINIHRDNRVDAHHRRVVIVESARAGADTKRHHPFGLAHLIINGF